MSAKVQKLSIRLLKENLTPEDGLRSGVTLEDWPTVEGGKIALDTMGGGAPKWTKFLALDAEQTKRVFNRTAFGLVFLQAAGRWFAVTFGMGHVKLDPAKFEQDFGLKVVLNAVDPKQLKSADVRTPDENTLQRRSQTSRGSDQSAFSIDIERDIVRGLAGVPTDSNFAVRVAGSDALSMDRKMEIGDLLQACADAFAMYSKTDYKTHFSWIDQIKHEREKAIIDQLEDALIAAVDAVVKGAPTDSITLAFPVIYNPERTHFLRFKGFRSSVHYPDLSFSNYLDALANCSKTEFTRDEFDSHTVHEVDDEGKDCGGKWKVKDCFTYETGLNGKTYVLSAGRWYCVDVNLAKSVQDFFDAVPRLAMPAALAGDNEEIYNARLKATEPDYLCLDRKLVLPTGATSRIEMCDFLTKDKKLIHVKDKTSSSRLSHLFNQGTVSGRVLILDGPARKLTRDKITQVQTDTGQTDYLDVIADEGQDFTPSDFTVVYAVLAIGSTPKLPFFSLVTLRQAAQELKALGYSYAFSWIEKPPSVAIPKKKADKKPKASDKPGEDANSA